MIWNLIGSIGGKVLESSGLLLQLNKTETFESQEQSDQ